MWRKKQKNNHQPLINPYDNIATFIDELPQEQTDNQPETIQKKPTTHHPKKTNTIQQHLTKGKPIFLQSNGNQIGIITDIHTATDNTPISYTIKDTETADQYTIPAQHLELTQDGAIYLPTWYTKSLNHIKQLEFYDTLNPELHWIFTDNSISPNEIYQLHIQPDPALQTLYQTTKTIHHLLTHQHTLLTKERTTVKQHIMDLIEERLIKTINRKNFAEKLQHHRNKATLLDIQLTRCTTLQERLQKTSLGHYLTITNQPTISPNKTDEITKKYHQLKEQYHTLQEQHTQLKKSIEKLLDQNLIH